jgi:bla regulator protein BlaR1
MSRTAKRNNPSTALHRIASGRTLPKWIAALPLAGLLVACSSFAQSDAGAGGDRQAVIDFHSCAKPTYPHDELAAGHQGTVRMAFLVNTDGSIASSRVEHTSGFPALDEAALSALSKCRFTPARKGGQPAQTWQTVQYVWTTE